MIALKGNRPHLALLLLLFAGCSRDPAPSPKAAPAEQRLDFSCERGEGFTVYFAADRQSVRLLYSGSEIRLERAPGDTTELFTANAIYFGSNANADGSRDGFVAEGETIVRDGCRGQVPAP